jgi:hypothetical protein
MAALASGLAERRISIDLVHAQRGQGGSWIAELHLVALDGAADPRSVSYIGLANQVVQLPGSCTLTLDRYELAAVPDHGGSLRLSFEAPDSLGLLGGLFCALAGLSLYPLEMHIETREGRAQDCLWLVADAAQVPSAEHERALRQLAEQSLRR